MAIAIEINAKLACKECMCIAEVSADSAKDFMGGAAFSTITARGQDQTASEQYACVQTLTWPADGGKTYGQPMAAKRGSASLCVHHTSMGPR
jgi:hypothetical protein